MKNNPSNEIIIRADEIFLAALELESADEQQAYVAAQCGTDHALLERVERLLKSLDHSQDFFAADAPTAITASEISRTLAGLPEFYEQMQSVLPDDGEVGKQIGPYKLLQKIGEGGVGNVYLAEQVTPVRRQVAFKIIKRGMDTQSVIARFEVERQALAMMEHPNIAHVLDAGETESGRPFFVMELVHGTRITTYCAEHNLSIRERLELLIQVCRGIQHAHQKGIIHRDIKPSNVLVSLHDDRPMPMVIDFGIAKATSDDLQEEHTVYSVAEPFIGTPAYMSPEQAQPGVDVDTRSDIYSLGIMLYELLVGAPPFDHKDLIKAGPDKMQQMLRDEEPLRPSIKLARLNDEKRAELARSCKTEVRHLQSIFNGDLDWIVMRSLEKDRERRYETVDAFAMDLEHFLKDEPVLARPPSRGYRFRKMVRRNKAACGFGLVIGLIMIAWITTSSLLLVKEHKARKRAVLAEHQEQKLRLNAEDRERITQAAFLISQDQIEEADALADQVSVLTPSLEAESVLRTLGEWHALQGRWEEAAERFSLLLKVDIKDSSWTITDDLLMAGPILIEQGNVQRYEKFRRAAIAQYQNTSGAVFAERTLKVCTLLTASPEMLRSLQPIKQIVAEGSGGSMVHDGMKAWSGISLAMMAFREADFSSAIDWCERCRTCADQNPARIAISQLIQSMATYWLGHIDEARALLNEGSATVEAIFMKPLERGDRADGFWYDWVYARILMREAAALVR